MKKAQLGFIAGALVVFYIAIGFSIGERAIPNHWWIVSIMTLSGPIGFIISGYLLGPTKNNEKSLLVASVFLTAYFVISICAPFLSYGKELGDHWSEILLTCTVLVSWLFGALVGGLNLGAYLREKISSEL